MTMMMTKKTRTQCRRLPLRLDADRRLRARLVQCNAERSDTDAVSPLASYEAISLLLLKSNYSLMYIEKVFDMLLHTDCDLLRPTHIAQMPSSLADLYSFMLRTLLDRTLLPSPSLSSLSFVAQQQHQNNKLTVADLIESLVGICALGGGCGGGRRALYARMRCRFATLSHEQFSAVFERVEPVLFRSSYSASRDSVVIEPFHASFTHWLLNVDSGGTLRHQQLIARAHFTLSQFYLAKLSKPNTSAIRMHCNHSRQQSQPHHQHQQRISAIWSLFKHHFVRSQSVFANRQQVGYFFQLAQHTYRQQQQQQRVHFRFAHHSATSTHNMSNNMNAVGDSDLALFLPTPSLLQLNIRANTEAPSVASGARLLFAIKMGYVNLAERLTLAIANTRNDRNELDFCEDGGWSPLRYAVWIGKLAVTNWFCLT